MLDNEELSRMLMDDNYSIERFLIKTRDEKIKLGQLCKQLRELQQDLNQTSLELLDRSYDRFYQLSYIIESLAAPIQNLYEPMRAFRDRLELLCKQHDDYIDNIDTSIKTLMETGRNKVIAKQLAELIERRNNLEQQIETHVDWSFDPVERAKLRSRGVVASSRALPQSSDDVDCVIRCDTMERISVELHHLECQLRALTPTNDELVSIKQALETSFDERQRQFDAWFGSLFLEAMDAKCDAVIAFILNTYEQRDAIHYLKLVWKRKSVEPYKRRAASAAPLSTSHSSPAIVVSRKPDVVAACASPMQTAAAAATAAQSTAISQQSPAASPAALERCSGEPAANFDDKTQRALAPASTTTRNTVAVNTQPAALGKPAMVSQTAFEDPSKSANTLSDALDESSRKIKSFATSFADTITGLF